MKRDYISCRMVLLRVLNEFLLKGNVIGRVCDFNKVGSINFIGDGEILAVGNEVC